MIYAKICGVRNELTEPRFGKAFRPLHEFLHGIPVEQGSGDRGVILENTADIVRAQAGINRMKGFRIRTFLAVNDLFGQFIGECAAHDALLTPLERLEVPRHIIGILDNAVVAEARAPSRPEYMLMRSLRSSRVAMNQSRLSTNISRIRAAFLSSDDSFGARLQVSR